MRKDYLKGLALQLEMKLDERSVKGLFSINLSQRKILETFIMNLQDKEVYLVYQWKN